MGSLVAAVAMSHNPRMFWNREAAPEAGRAAVQETFDAVHAQIAAARPDFVIVVANDHLDNFGLECVPGFTVGLGERAEGPFWYEQEIMHLPQWSGRVDEAAGLSLIESAASAGLDLAHSRRYTLDHAFTVPLSSVVRDLPVRLLPIISNVFVYPIPDQHRFHRLGETMAQFIANRPSDERVAVIGSMNLSVEVGGPRMGQRDDAFDRDAMQLIREGNTARILDEMTPARLVGVGNSAPEFLNYVAVLGALGRRPPDLVTHHVIPQWGGCPVVAWDLAA